MTNRNAYFWLALFALGTIGFTVVQDYIRPNYHGESDWIKYCLGVAPNYFAGLGLSSFFVVMIHQINSSAKKPTPSVWLNGRAHFSGMIISVTGLFVWECMQTFSNRGHVDIHDFIWTLIGALTFYVIWLVMNRKSFNDN
jgi:hypothetical protein